MTFIVNEWSQRMSNPTQQNPAQLKRPVRYLKRERQKGTVVQLCKNGRRSDDIFHAAAAAALAADS